MGAGNRLVIQFTMNNLTVDLPSLLTPKELASFLRISQPSVYRLVEKRALSFIKVGGSLRFPREDVETYLEQNRIKSFNEL